MSDLFPVLIKVSSGFYCFVTFYILITTAKFDRYSFFTFFKNLKFLTHMILILSLLEPTFDFQFIDFKTLIFKVLVDTYFQLPLRFLSFFVGLKFGKRLYLLKCLLRDYFVYPAASFQKLLLFLIRHFEFP